MAMGIPVITNAGVGDVAGIVEKYHSGIVLKNLKEKEFKETADKIEGNIFFDKSDIRNAALEYYNLANAIEKYYQVYQNILE